MITRPSFGSALVFNSTAGNPDGKVNYSRTFQSEDGPQDLGSNGLSFFAQDSVRLGRFPRTSASAPSDIEHFNTLGEDIYTFDWTLAPRTSLVLRRSRRRQAEADRVLRPLLRPDPQQHDPVRRLAQRPHPPRSRSSQTASG